MVSAFDRRAIPANARESGWTAPDGFSLRRIDWPTPADGPARGSILYLPGRGDFYEKYLETLNYWSFKGWRVTAADWRWQAGSGRYGTNAHTGDVSDFSAWVDDLAALWSDWRKETPGPHVLAAHSMGGHIVLRAIAENRVNPDAVILSAPMLGFLTPLPLAVQPAFGRFMAGLGDPGRMAWRVSEKPGTPLSKRASLLTHDTDRYADELWWRQHRPELEMGPASWRWVWRAAESVARLNTPGLLEAVQVPILIVAARYDGLVSYRAVARAARRLPHAELKTWGREARHELLREEDTVRDQVLAAIDDYLDRTVPAPQG